TCSSRPANGCSGSSPTPTAGSTGSAGAARTCLADPGREGVDLSRQPVQVQAQGGTKAQSEALARSGAPAAEAPGVRHGPGGTVLRVEGTLEESDETITFAFGAEVKLPRCVISGRWLSPQRSELWKGKMTARWSPSASKYKVSEKHESFGPGGSVQRFEFDFGGRNPSSAMREELVETLGDQGDSGWVQLPELQFLRAGGQDHPVPVVETMGVRLPPGAK